MKHSWIRYSYGNPKANIRLFCFPYAGYGTSAFRDWYHRFSDRIEICPVQLPGRECRWDEPAYTDLPSLIDALCDDLTPFLQMRFALFGYCVGALVAFELARTLQREFNTSPCHLFVAAHAAPNKSNRMPAIHTLSNSDFIEQVARYEGIRPELLQNRGILAAYLPMLRADFALSEKYLYTPSAPLVCPISAFGGYTDATVTVAELDNWRCETTSEFTLKLFDGSHFFIKASESELLTTINEQLVKYTSV